MCDNRLRALRERLRDLRVADDRAWLLKRLLLIPRGVRVCRLALVVRLLEKGNSCSGYEARVEVVRPYWPRLTTCSGCCNACS